MIKNAQLHIDFYKEGKQVIAYCRALDLSTCGDTFEQAKSRFEEALELFLEEVAEMGTTEEVLLECGWQKTKSKKHPLVPPVFITSLEEKVNIPYKIA